MGAIADALVDMTDVRVAAEKVLLEDFADRKLEVADVTTELEYAAYVYLQQLTITSRTLPFLADLRDRADRGQKLSAGQIKGALNCWRADVIRRKAQQEAPKDGLDISGLVSGYYAVEHDGKLHFLRIDNIDDDDNRWHGWTFVKTQHGDNFERAGAQRPGQSFTGKALPLVEKIAQAPLAAMQRYGTEIGRCGVCHHTLTDEVSRARGIGPECIKKFGGSKVLGVDYG